MNSPAADDDDSPNDDLPLPPLPPLPVLPQPPQPSPPPPPPPQNALFKFRRWLSRFGWDSLALSIAAHIILFIAASTWIIAHYAPPPPKPETFVTGAGGGKNGSSEHNFEHRIRREKTRNFAQNAPRITSRSATASVSLPELTPSNFKTMQNASGTAGDASKGFGDGAGGGRGNRIGIGSGGGRNFVPKFVMGMPVKAKKIAVYLDNSGSMTPYLPLVKKEIYAQFPDADIFEANGIFTRVVGGEVSWGRRFKPSKAQLETAKRKMAKAAANTAKTAPDTHAPKPSATRSAILKKWGPHFYYGSVGAWMDIMLFEKYDALVMFSDFQDGIQQYSAKGKKIYTSRGATSPADKRTADDKTWEKHWLDRCADTKNAPRIYLFSIQIPPQPLWQDCVKISGGEIKMVRHLRETIQDPKTENSTKTTSTKDSKSTSTSQEKTSTKSDKKSADKKSDSKSSDKNASTPTRKKSSPRRHEK